MSAAVTRHESSSAVPPVRELWLELSATMRRLRMTAEVSLRQVESESRVGRGTLSQFETGKARPNRTIVEWYDTQLGGDGLLLSLYAEARGAHGPVSAGRAMAHTPGDALAIAGFGIAFGAFFVTGSTVMASWTLHNTGIVPWRSRRLERVGARAGIRLISSASSVPVPECQPGQLVECAAELEIPAVAATYVAYWQMADERGQGVLPFDPCLCVQVVAREAP